MNEGFEVVKDKKMSKEQKKTEKTQIPMCYQGPCPVKIEDAESGSKAFMPVELSDGWQMDVVKLDKGVIQDLKEGEEVSDILFSVFQEGRKVHITCLAELKGSGQEHKANKAVSQMEKTATYLTETEKYLSLSEYLAPNYMMAAIVGAPDKKIPKCTSRKDSNLYKWLFRMSKQRGHIKNMEGLLFYVQLNKEAKCCQLLGNTAPYTVSCHASNGKRIPVPQALEELLARIFKEGIIK